MNEIRFYETASGRSQPKEFLLGLPEKYRAHVATDIERVAEYGHRAPASVKPIKGHRPMEEIRTGGYRIFFFFKNETLVVLHICKKQDQEHSIDVAHERMRDLLEG